MPWGEKEGAITGISATLRFVDWDEDGDVDVLAMDIENASVWFQERCPNGTFRLHQLADFPGIETENVAAEWGERGHYYFFAESLRFEVVDWDGDFSRQTCLIVFVCLFQSRACFLFVC